MPTDFTLTALAAQARELAREIATTADRLRQVLMIEAVLGAVYDAATAAERAQGTAALLRYGHHSAGCATHAAGTWMHADAAECGCGLLAALRGDDRL